ncbi:MAG: phosphoribosylamine--glycine ligase [Candidatus Eisenbacteria bacterium]
MKVVILGGGGREHALAWAVQRHHADWDIVVAPGNGGTDGAFRNVPVAADDPAAVLALARAESPDLVVIGPEAPLVAGVGDRLVDEGYAVFGPSARAAEIEGSKVFAKELMHTHGIPTAAFDVYSIEAAAMAAVRKGLFPKVVKADGLAAGKGAIVVETPSEGEEAVRTLMCGAFGAAGKQVVIESFLQGEEASAFAICRDEEFLLLPLSQDHKRIGEGDTGPNTGGMGAYTPYPRTTPELLTRIRETVIAPTLRVLAGAGRPFRGLLYAGLMIDGGVPSVVEFNCRFGDPETQALAPLFGPGFADALNWSATGEGNVAELERSVLDSGEGGGAPSGHIAAATVVLASAGYPGSYATGTRIEGLRRAMELPDTVVFHAGTKRQGDALVTSGGRVLAVTGTGPDLRSALGRAYEGVSTIEFEGKTYRRDIGHRALK